MEWILFFVAVLLLFTILLMLSTLHIELQFVHRNDNSDVQITLRMYRFLRYTLKIPLIQFDAKDHAVKIKEEKKASLGTEKKKKKRITFRQFKNQYKSFRGMLIHVQNFYHIIRHFLSKMKVENIAWHSAVGLGEASASAIAAGSLWGIKGVVLQLINTFFILKGNPSVSVVPVFQGMHSETRFSCMVSFKIGHAIVVMLKIMKAWRGTKNPSRANNEYMTGGM
ncbi:DUF2953 domain-containing protein [Bacillus sp. NEB1478]|uniref:DUF2953 domain-containing protein n=1 Tax=Bacillus sp. NEB1478 TaxID=3073816 RepID=UPI0028734E7F|nr:DUF2953 domain-containing protein [Bacillus sp. NEB1478]WNB93142.1 DUF2953 domain-containing protein [Bacillus sp. NEB1478]